MIKTIKYSVLILIIALYIERIHRIIYDTIFVQHYKIKFKDELKIKYYRFLRRLFPGFRQYLKYWKYVLNRAYNQKKLSFKNQIGFWKIRNKNVKRYSSYFLLI